MLGWMGCFTVIIGMNFQAYVFISQWLGKMLGAKYGFVHTMDCAVQSMDPRIVRQSMDCLLDPCIAQCERLKDWSCAYHGLAKLKCG